MALFAIVLLACGVGNDDSDGTDRGGAQPEEEPSEVGRDGQFEFTVNTMECDVTEIGDDLTTETAQGESA